jgi:UDP-N-acetylglucosamine pyrophosphorylase
MKHVPELPVIISAEILNVSQNRSMLNNIFLYSLSSYMSLKSLLENNTVKGNAVP